MARVSLLVFNVVKIDSEYISQHRRYKTVERKQSHKIIRQIHPKS